MLGMCRVTDRRVTMLSSDIVLRVVMRLRGSAVMLRSLLVMIRCLVVVLAHFGCVFHVFLRDGDPQKRECATTFMSGR